MSRWRLIEKAFAEIKERDPDTDLTKTALRRLVTTGAVPSARIGAKYLVDLDDVERYLRGELKQIQQEPEPPQLGVIRRIGA